MSAPLTPARALTAALQSALAATAGSAYAQTDPLLARSKQPGFDYQANIAMRLAKAAGMSPQVLADDIVAALGNGGGLLDSVEVSGPGFINLRLSDSYVAACANAALASERLAVAATAQPQTVVVDYSSPNVAKPMHVGHLRSTVIGDALARTLRFGGDRVVAQNHLGDWGTQFGMLVQQMVETGSTDSTDFEALSDLYRAAKTRFDADEPFAARARARVVALQAGDPDTIALWRTLVDCSREHMNATYAELGASLTDADVRGESFYNPWLAPTIAALRAVGVAADSDGATIVRSESLTSREGTPAALVIEKSDGGFGYAATDFAALHYRIYELGAQRVIYVTDVRQAQHFAIVFEVAARAGWTEGVALQHVAFGMVMGEEGTPFKTRDGSVVALADLLGEAVRRAREVVDERSPQLPAAERAAVAQIIGIGAVKYADLTNALTRNYRFSFTRMLALEGNTAPYLQYAHVRAASIAAKAAEDAATIIALADPAERALALKCLGFADAVAQVTESLEPHKLCTYLFELAGTYTAFYEACPVLKAPDAATRTSRLALCALTARTLARGLDLLGIGVPARM